MKFHFREEKSGSKGGKGNLVLNFTRIKPQELFSTHKLQQTVDYSTGTTTAQQQKKKSSQINYQSEFHLGVSWKKALNASSLWVGTC